MRHHRARIGRGARVLLQGERGHALRLLHQAETEQRLGGVAPRRPAGERRRREALMMSSVPPRGPGATVKIRTLTVRRLTGIMPTDGPLWDNRLVRPIDADDGLAGVWRGP